MFVKAKIGIVYKLKNTRTCGAASPMPSDAYINKSISLAILTRFWSNSVTTAFSFLS